MVTAIVNGLAATPHRRAFLRAVNERGRVVYYRSAGDAYDNKNSSKVTARLQEAFRHGWVEPIPADEPHWPGATPKIHVYYRLTDLGRTAMGDKR